MKRLLLLRHAKAHPSRGEPDHARVLDARGLADAEQVGRVLAALGLRPDVALVSDARRTRDTFAGLARHLDPPPTLLLAPALYEAAPETILRLIRDVSPQAGSVLVVAHNPGIGELARRMAAQGPADDLARLRCGFQTAALAVLEIEVESWPEIEPHRGRLAALHWPDATRRPA